MDLLGGFTIRAGGVVESQGTTLISSFTIIFQVGFVPRDHGLLAVSWIFMLVMGHLIASPFTT